MAIAMTVSGIHNRWSASVEGCRITDRCATGVRPTQIGMLAVSRTAQSELLTEKAATLRKLTLEMISAAGSGHPGSSLSTIEILTCLYYAVMDHGQASGASDRFVLSKGHAAPALYAVLIDRGEIASHLVGTLRQLGSPLQGHPDTRFTPGVTACAGSLGQGFSVAVGVALGERRRRSTSRVFCLVGDGECQEGQVWESALLAAQHGLDNLAVVVDANGLQHDGRTSDILDVDPLIAKWAAFGWSAVEVDGHDLDALVVALAAQPDGRPRAVVARTIKGKGVSAFEDRVEWHSVKDVAAYRAALADWSAADA
jgi:transketolase